jgi:CSLREA domain-containing protein
MKRVSFVWLMVVALVSASSGWLLFVPPTYAATITVTTTVDELTDPGPGTGCSLREAIQAANTDTAFGGCPAGSGTDVITLPAGIYILTIGGVDDTNAGGDLDILTSLTINGAGLSNTIINGNGGVTTDRTINVLGTGAAVSISGVTIAGGRTGGLGGGILNSGTNTTLTVTDSRLTGNSAGNGGGISNATGDTVVVSNTTFDGNVTTSVGGGGLINSGIVTITSSTFSGNTAPINGGGINTQGGGTTSVTNSTFSENTSGSLGGGISNLGTLNLIQSTLRGNRGSAGNGIATGNTNISLRASIFANATAGGGADNCSPTGVVGATLGSNVADDATCFANGGTDQVVADVKLGPLANNGGLTQTNALLEGSPAIDAVQGSCTSDGTGGGSAITTDQRRVGRPYGVRCDAGAFERATGVLQFSNPTYNVSEAGGNATITVTRSGGFDGAVGATFSTADGSATAPADYTAVSSPVNFTDGDTAPKNVQVPVVNDTVFDPNETVNLSLANPAGGASLGAQATAVLTILDDDVATSTPTPTPTGTPVPTATATPTATPQRVVVNVTRAGANRLQVSLSTPSSLDTINWTPAPNFSVEDATGVPVAGGQLKVPNGSTSAVFYVRRLSGGAVTVPLTLTGGFGTWQTFVGGGPDAWP